MAAASNAAAAAASAVQSRRRGSAWAWNSSSPRRSARCAKRKRLAEAPRAKMLPSTSSIGVAAELPGEVGGPDAGALQARDGELPGLGEEQRQREELQAEPDGERDLRAPHLLRLRLVGGVCHLGSARGVLQLARHLVDALALSLDATGQPGGVRLGELDLGAEGGRALGAQERFEPGRALTGRGRAPRGDDAAAFHSDRDGEPRRRYGQHGEVLREAMLQEVLERDAAADRQAGSPEGGVPAQLGWLELLAARDLERRRRPPCAQLGKALTHPQQRVLLRPRFWSGGPLARLRCHD